jgi:hypothetical protein
MTSRNLSILILLTAPPPPRSPSVPRWSALRAWLDRARRWRPSRRSMR